MTTSARARRLAADADRSQARSDAYRYLAELIRTDPKLAALIESEYDQAIASAREFAEDADYRRAEAARVA